MDIIKSSFGLSSDTLRKYWRELYLSAILNSTFGKKVKLYNHFPVKIVTYASSF